MNKFRPAGSKGKFLGLSEHVLAWWNAAIDPSLSSYFTDDFHLWCYTDIGYLAHSRHCLCDGSDDVVAPDELRTALEIRLKAKIDMPIVDYLNKTFGC